MRGTGHIDRTSGLPADRVAELLNSRFSELFPGDLRDGSGKQTAKFVSQLFRECRERGRGSKLACDILRVREKRAAKRKARNELMSKFREASKEKEKEKRQQKHVKRGSRHHLQISVGFSALQMTDEESSSDE